MTVDRLAVCEPLPEPQELGLEHLQLRTGRDDTSRCGADYIRSVQRRATKCASATTSIACAVQESAHQVLILPRALGDGEPANGGCSCTSARSIVTGLCFFEGADRVPKCLHGWHLRLSAGEDRSRPERHIIMAARFQTLRGEPNGPPRIAAILI